MLVCTVCFMLVYKRGSQVTSYNIRAGNAAKLRMGEEIFF